MAEKYRPSLPLIGHKPHPYRSPFSTWHTHIIAINVFHAEEEKRRKKKKSRWPTNQDKQHKRGTFFPLGILTSSRLTFFMQKKKKEEEEEK